MVLDESKVLDLTKKDPNKTAEMIESFIKRHQQEKGGSVAFYTGKNPIIVNNVINIANKNRLDINQDYMYNRGCIIVEINVNF